MNWTGEYVIEGDGLCHWRERMTIDDPELVKACQDNPLTHLFVEMWAEMGVKVGVAYHHRAAVKGAGADCAMFPLRVYRECHVIPAGYEPPEYSSQWHLHRSEELYLTEIYKFAVETFCPPRPADFVVFKFGRTFSHGTIVVDWPLIVHSYIPHGVTLADALSDAQLAAREMKCFEI